MTTTQKFEIHKALGHPIRYQIITLLLAEPRCVGELEEATGASQANTSQNLNVLKHAGIIEAERKGTMKYYSIRREIRPSIQIIVDAL